LSSALSVQSLLPVLSVMTRGDVVTVPLDVAGWKGDVVVTARVASAVTSGTFAKFEFEDGSDSFASAGTFREGRARSGFGIILKGKATPDTPLSGQLGTVRDSIANSSVGDSGRMFNRGKTPEPALLIDTRIQLDLDFSDVTRLGQSLRPGPDATPDHLQVTLPVPVASPTADSLMAPPPKKVQHYLPPLRIEQTLSLGGSDIVRDVYAVDANGARTGGGLRSLLGDAADPNSLEAVGAGCLGDAWPQVKEELLTSVDLLTLHAELKSMTAGQQIVLPLSENRGSLLISAMVDRLTHRRNTDQTEFNAGTDITRTVTNSQTYSWSGQAPFSAQNSDFGDAPLRGTGGVFAQYGRDRTDIDQVSVRAGNAVKVKAPGAVFDGVARLTFSYHRSTGLGPAAAVAAAALGFELLAEAAESRAVPEPQSFAAQDRRPGPLRLLAPPIDVNGTAWRPAPEVWGFDARGRRLPRQGLPEGTVVLDMFVEHTPAQPAAGALAGPVAAGPLPARGINTVLDELGRGFFTDSAWAELQPSVRNTFRRERLAAWLPTMTRGIPSVGPLLVQPLQKDAKVSAVARVDRMEFLRVIDKAELNVLNEAVEGTANRRVDWRYYGGQAQGGYEDNLADGDYVAVPVIGGGRSTRHREGTRAAQTSSTTSSSKFPEPMAVFLVTARVDVTFARLGSTKAPAVGNTDVRFWSRCRSRTRSCTPSRPGRRDRRSSPGPRPRPRRPTTPARRRHSQGSARSRAASRRPAP
jgi:hypothetical protein